MLKLFGAMPRRENERAKESLYENLKGNLKKSNRSVFQDFRFEHFKSSFGLKTSNIAVIELEIPRADKFCIALVQQLVSIFEFLRIGTGTRISYN